MNEIQEKCLQALKSGEYKQQAGSLGNVNKGYCCLGVFGLIAGTCEEAENGDIYEKEDDGSFENLIRSYKQLGLRDENGTISKPSEEQLKIMFVGGEKRGSLVELNDRNVPFSEIARLIRLNPKAVFTDIED